jgi:bifunctional non-homologous end joining protein LigD
MSPKAVLSASGGSNIDLTIEGDGAFAIGGAVPENAGLNVDKALIDGEAVVLREDGRSHFGALLTKRSGGQASLVGFDLVRLNGDDQRLRPLEGRREALLASLAVRPLLRHLR